MAPVDYSTQTTLVTGASSGIGASLAHLLASRGSDLVLVARRGERLERLAEELRGLHGIRVETIVADLTEPAPGARLLAETQRRGMHVTSLVNNAGFGADGAFLDADPEKLRALLALNVSALVDITRAFIEQLSAAGTGFLVNIASVAAYQPIPGMAVYAASKTFVLHFTEALWLETRGSGLRVLAFSPGLTRTEFFDGLTEQYAGGFQTPEEVATALLRALDRRDPGPSALSRRSAILMTAFSRLLSRRTVVKVVGRVVDAPEYVRSRPAAAVPRA